MVRSRRLHIKERASFSDVCGAYRQARVVVMASSYEGLPTVILEAMYFGSPVVAARVGGIPYVLDANCVGHTYELLDGEGYISALDGVLGDTAGARQVAKRLVEDRYSWERNAPSILAVYRRLAGKPERHRA